MGSAKVRYLSPKEGVRARRLMADWAAKADALRRLGPATLQAPESCSPQGLELLSVALSAHTRASPSALVVSIPAERRAATPPILPPRTGSSFPLPE